MRYSPRGDRWVRERARSLRREQTSAETLLWRQLRRKALGHRFRRQEPIGPYIVDFVCRSRRLVVEVDGETHQDRQADRRRDRHLGRLGFRVLRFWNAEIYENLEGVIERIFLELEQGDIS